uniref:Caspase a n=1 Tax=Astatotilapia calliptera TaxID=8154 RepID=A0AAX7SCD4_ASTCA
SPIVWSVAYNIKFFELTVKELDRLRKEFVSRVSQKNLKQLLEALVTDGILNVTEESISKRVALLITNKTFDGYSTRHGAEKDEYEMHCMLADLGYDVVKCRNLTVKEIEEALQKFSKHPHLVHTDSVFVVIMSHGSLQGVCGTDCKPFEIENIYKSLNTQNCPALHNKPKVIIIQACRGGDFHSFIPEIGRNIETDAVVHKEKDFISLLSCTPNTTSYRDESYGSYFIQYIVEIFKEFADVDHIEELFRKVMQRFEESEFGEIQMPSKDRCTLTKNFYLLPY